MMRIITKQQAISWLKKQPANSTYSYWNKPEPCLFSQIARAVLKDDTSLCFGFGEVIGATSAEVPFHNAFWNRIWKKGRYTVTKRRALQILRSL